MSKVTDINKFREEKSTTEGNEADTPDDYMQILIGEDIDKELVIVVEQVETVGNTIHKGKLVLDVDMLHRLIENLMAASEAIKEGDFT
tara:strand:- start:2090 stop:2353 length:264 start_codon:yes stop_codon:yes gene_type:complete